MEFGMVFLRRLDRKSYLPANTISSLNSPSNTPELPTCNNNSKCIVRSRRRVRDMPAMIVGSSSRSSRAEATRRTTGVSSVDCLVPAVAATSTAGEEGNRVDMAEEDMVVRMSVEGMAIITATITMAMPDGRAAVRTSPRKNGPPPRPVTKCWKGVLMAASGFCGVFCVKKSPSVCNDKRRLGEISLLQG